MAKNSNNNDDWIALIIAGLSFILLKSIFDNDNSKIVSKKGKEILKDKSKMEGLYRKIETAGSRNNNQEITI